jgi:excisionase family DNA binding protein
VLDLKAKEFLTVRNVATLLNSSIRTAYRLIQTGKIQAVNISERKTLVKRSEIDKLFEQPKPIEQIQKHKPKPVQYQYSECYTIPEIQNKFGVSESAIYATIKRFNIPRLKKGIS